jgi:two-component system sensor histidine kinase VicK
MQEVLFDKFTKARRPGLRGERTTGLGMSVIKTIVELHQGRIWLESAEGQGTTFYVELPALPA